MRITVLALGTFVLGVSACSDAARQPVGPATPSGATAAAAVARAKPVPNARAAFAYVTVATSSRGGRLIGDLRAANGDPAVDSSVYNDGECGVSAEIFVEGSGDATMDPTGGSTLCGAARSLTVSFGSPLAAAPDVNAPSGLAIGSFFTNVRDVQSLGVGVTGERRFRLLLRNFPGCDYLRYEDAAGLDGQPGTSDDVSFNGFMGRSILVTRLSDVGAKRRWLAESQPSSDGHVAFCERAARKGSVYVGAYDIPFKLVVTEK